MIRKQFVLILFVLIGLFLIAAYWIWNYDDEKDRKQVLGIFASSQNQMSIEQFLEYSKGHKISRIEVFYLPFWAESITPISEKEVLSVSRTFVILNKYYQPCPAKITETLMRVAGLKAKKMPENFRYCCLMYSGSDKVIRFSITSPWHGENPLCINGIPYNVDISVIDAFLKFLPVTDYELAIKDMKEQGLNIESSVGK